MEPLRRGGHSASRAASGRSGVPGGDLPEARTEGCGDGSARRRSFAGPGLSRAGQPSLQTRLLGPGRAANSGCQSGEISTACDRCLFPFGLGLCGYGQVT